MKKGFTLIELLSVIIILAIILVVAVPKIMQAIESSKINSYISNEKLVLKSAELFVSKNIDSLPVNVGDTTEILLSSLITDGYIKDIKSPFNKNNSCSGYITITKTESDLYDYTPHINCTDNTIVSSTQDKLLFHYKFDDFQEPTENVLANGVNLINQRTLDILDANGTLSYSSNSGYNNRSYYVERVIKSNAAPSNHASYRKCIPTAGANINYAISYKVKILSGDISSVGVHINGGTTTQTPKYIDNDGWYYFERTLLTSSTTLCGGVGFVGSNYADVLITEPQIEFKEYATPFVNGIRQGTIKDHSINNNNAVLDLVTTPTWKSNSRSGNGTYRFNGANYSTTLINENINSFTISMWVNPYYYGDSNSKTITGLGTSSNILSVMRDTGAYSSGPIWFEYRQNGNLDIYLRRLDTVGIRIVAPLLPVDKWTHITVTYDINQGKAILYFDGKAVVEGINATLGTLGTAGRVFLGTGLGSNVGYHYNGYIDDVRMYNRLLTTEEVNAIYNTSK